MENNKELYTPEKLMQYHVAVAVVENMEKQNLVSTRDKRKMLTALAKKYGLNSCSIFSV